MSLLLNNYVKLKIINWKVFYNKYYISNKIYKLNNI